MKILNIVASIIQIPFSEDINILLTRAKEEAKYYKGDFNGNTKSGNFTFEALGSKFIGFYKIERNIIEVTLDKKPLLIPIFVIETFLKTHIK